MLLLSLHLTDLNQHEEIERFLFLFSLGKFSTCPPLYFTPVCCELATFVEISVAKCCLAMATKMVGAWGAALEPER